MLRRSRRSSNPSRCRCLALATLLFAPVPLAAQELWLASHTSSNQASAGNGDSAPDAISADGRYVAFRSMATNLVAGGTDTNLNEDAFLWDRNSGSVTLISRAAGTSTTAADDFSRPTAISADGRYVALWSLATDLIAGASDENGSTDLFLWDRDTGTVTLISHAAGQATATGNGGSDDGYWISANGRYVAFRSEATDLIAGGTDENSTGDAYLWDRDTGAVTLISHAAGTAATAGNGHSTPSEMSSDGRYVAFYSYATDLIAGGTDSNATRDAFLWDRDTGAVTLISRAAGTTKTAGDDESVPGAMSADGRYVALTSASTDLIAGLSDTNATDDVFLWDRQTGAMTLVSDAAGTPTTTGNNASYAWAMSADGAFVAVLSQASNLSVGQADVNGAGGDAFLWDRTAGAMTLVSHAGGAANFTGNGPTAQLAMSADGQTMLIESQASNLVDGGSDVNGTRDVFLWDRAGGENRLLSHAAVSETTAGNAESRAGVLSADGKTMAFWSNATTLMAGSFNGFRQAFVARPNRIFADGFEKRRVERWNAAAGHECVIEWPAPKSESATLWDGTAPDRYILYAAANQTGPEPTQLLIEIFEPTGGPMAPALVDLELNGNNNYSTCGTCVQLYLDFNDVSQSYDKVLFQREGSLDISALEPTLGGDFDATLSLVLEEVTIDIETFVSTPVPNGCVATIDGFVLSEALVAH